MVNLWAAIVTILAVASLCGDCVPYDGNQQPPTLPIGLRFSKEPPNRLDFVNTKGGRLECAATIALGGQHSQSSEPDHSSTSVRVNWTHVDGTAIGEIPGLRDVSSDGTVLTFRSFGAEKFRPDVHSAIYRCSASSIAAGTIHSTNINVRGVVLQNYDVQVYDTYAIEGSAAVFKCHVPAVLSEYVKVVGWIKNDNLLIQNAIGEGTPNGEKYAVMPSGELIVRNVQASESGSKYKCKTIHELTGDAKFSSNAGQLFVTGEYS